jgi:predicted nucleic-acid-binding protein
VRITADTNLLVRVLVEDDGAQAARARAVLADASLVAVPVPVLCELVWVLRRRYGLAVGDIADALETLLDSATVATDRPAADAGLRLLRAGGDFADGAIAHQGRALGAEMFLTFDERAAMLLRGEGVAAGLP